MHMQMRKSIKTSPAPLRHRRPPLVDVAIPAVLDGAARQAVCHVILFAAHVLRLPTVKRRQQLLAHRAAQRAQALRVHVHTAADLLNDEVAVAADVDVAAASLQRHAQPEDQPLILRLIVGSTSEVLVVCLDRVLSVRDVVPAAGEQRSATARGPRVGAAAAIKELQSALKMQRTCDHAREAVQREALSRSEKQLLRASAGCAAVAH